MRWRAVAVVAGTVLVALVSEPVNAGTTSTTDPIGVDYDAACAVDTATSPPPPNSVTSAGCPGISTYDGSTTGTDVTSASLGSNATGHLVATFHIAGDIPAAGSTARATGTAASFDLPNAHATGAAYFNLFQNKSRQTNVAYFPCASSGTGPGPLGPQTQSTPLLPNPSPPQEPTIPSIGGGGGGGGGGAPPPLDRHESWKDGYHFYVNLVVNWDGTRWLHTVHVGKYDPAPDGGLPFVPLGHNDGTGWRDSGPHMTKGVHWDVSITPGLAGGTDVTVSFSGSLRMPDPVNCASGVYRRIYATPGDVIANYKLMSTTNMAMMLPVSLPLSLTCGVTGGIVCTNDIVTVGGFVIPSDLTDGNSTAGLANTNISGIAYTRGAAGSRELLSNMPDTLGDGPTCPTPTLNGLLPQNPVFTSDTACQIDDEPVQRGSFLPEMWDTTHGFTF